MPIRLRSYAYLILWRVSGRFGTSFRPLGRANELYLLCVEMSFMMEMKNRFAVMIEDNLMNLQRSTEYAISCDGNK